MVRIYLTNRAEAQKRGKMLLTDQYANTFTAENGAVQTQIPQIKFTDDEIDTLIAMFGTPASYNSKGCLKKLNELFFTELFIRHNLIRFESGEVKFYRYEHETGLWTHVTEEAVNELVSSFILSYIHERKNFDFLELLQHSFVKKVVAILKGKTESKGLFEKAASSRRVHCSNCVLEFDSESNSWVRNEFSPGYFSRNRTEIVYDPEADAPRFINDLLKPAMHEEDIETLQRYCGQCLLGENISQTFLMLTGTAGGGKSTLVNIVEMLISRTNCHELRLSQVDRSRFETQRYIGKTLLTGKDVKSDFLDTPGAFKLKALTGGDTMTCENKHSCNTAEIAGKFNVLITSNASLRVRLDNDAAAWKRRMLWIKFDRPAVPLEKRIDNFAELLIQQEGSGILNWAMEGAVKLLSEGGKIKLQEIQLKRVEILLEETDSLRLFVRDCIQPSEEFDVSCNELWAKFNEYRAAHELDGMSQKQFFKDLPDLMEQEHHVIRRNDIMRNGRSVRGYAHIVARVK